eukprot:jgi/Tetstr1/465859/TSEL_010477.t1
MALTTFVRMPWTRLGHMARGRPNGVDQLRARDAEATGGAWCTDDVAAQISRVLGRGSDQDTWCSGGLAVPTNCVPKAAAATEARRAVAGHWPRKRPGHMALWRPDGADQLRVRDCEGNRLSTTCIVLKSRRQPPSTWYMGGLMAPTTVAAAAALQDMAEQMRRYKAEAAALREDNNTLRADFTKYIETHEAEATSHEAHHAQVAADAAHLRQLVAELRQALATSTQEVEALRKEKAAMESDVEDLKAKMAEYSGIVDELGDRARAAEAELGDTQRHAVKLAKALHEEKSKGGRAGHLLAEQRQAMDRLQASEAAAAARATELQQRVAAAEESVAAEGRRVKAAQGTARAAEERAQRAGSRVGELEREKVLLEERVGELAAAHQRTQAQLEATKARAADRLREQEERLGARASDAVEQALEERDTARRDAETARAAEARANELLRVSQQDMEALQAAHAAGQKELVSLQAKASEAAEALEAEKAALASEMEAHAATRTALAAAEANSSQLAELHQAVVDKYVKAIDADKDAALSPRDAFRPGHEGGASPLSGRMAALRASGESPLSEITHVVVPEQRRRRGRDIAVRGSWDAPPAPCWEPPARSHASPPRIGAPHRTSDREQIDAVIRGLEEELRALDLQYNNMLRKSQEEASCLGGSMPSAANWREELAHGTRKVFRRMQRKGEQIAQLRRQAMQLPPH